MKIFSYLLLPFSFFFSVCLHAHPHWKLFVDKIAIESQTDVYGDQLYFFIIEQKDGVPDSYITMPSFPFSYTQQNLESFKPMIVWDGEVDPAHQIKLIVSLFDREALPWIPDELIGNFAIGFNSMQQPLWVSMGPEAVLDQSENSLVQNVAFHQGNGKYHIQFHLEKSGS